MTKIKLDEIIEKHKAQPVGHGFIDIIVARHYYQDFVSDLVNNGYIYQMHTIENTLRAVGVE